MSTLTCCLPLVRTQAGAREVGQTGFVPSLVKERKAVARKHRLGCHASKGKHGEAPILQVFQRIRVERKTSGRGKLER